MKTFNNNAGSPPVVDGVKNVLRALRNRNYRLFFFGQGISLIGTWMQNVAVSWMVYRLTDSVLYLGIVGFSSQIPILLAAPLGGVLADRWNKKTILKITQFLSMLQAFILAALVITANIHVWQIITLSICLGIINGFDMPTRQAFVYEMVDNQGDLPNAIALNSLIFNGARLIGPTIAGILIVATGEGVCFLINAISFVPVLAAFGIMKVKIRDGLRQDGHIFIVLKDGVKYAFGFAPIKIILALLAFIGLVAMPYVVLLPVFAREILHGDARTLGFLMGTGGVGAITGAIFLASQKNVSKLSNIIVSSMCVFAVGAIAFSMSKVLWFSMIMTALIGFGIMVLIAAINTVLQSIVDDDKRGRVMSLYTMAFIGMAPFGSLLAGSVAHFIGAPYTIFAGAVLCLLAAAVFNSKLAAIKKAIHPIFVRKGILPQVASGIGTAAQLSAETKE
jgi:MFS family permease